jgi:septal ring factor EnvC (AmiA/AmiB activator)
MALKSLPTSALRAELARREKGAAKLAKKRDAVARVLAAFEAQLADLGVPGGKRRGRPPGSKNKKRRGKRLGRPPGSKNKRKAGRKLHKNKQSLGAALAAAVRPGTIVSPAEAAKRVRAQGYKTIATNFGKVVTLRLRVHKQFKHRSRGQYERVA